MCKIKIKNFGPIKEGYQDNDGWIELKKVTLFIGDQGSGKSTLAKTISTLLWLEKSINRGDTNKAKLTYAKFREFFKYQKIYNYFSDNTYIEYQGDKFHIIYNGLFESEQNIKIIEVIEDFQVPKIMYIPAERNFLSTISDAYNIKRLPENLFSFAEELKKAQKELGGKELELPLTNYCYEYIEEDDSSYIIGTDYRINLLEASSGLQSFIPLYLVSRNLSLSISKVTDEEIRKNMSVTQSLRMDKEILMLDKTMELKKKEIEIDKIRSRYYNKCFINIVEEPEQNLFPSSQQKMINSLLELNNINEGNKLILTTHSPYIINFITLAVKANILLVKMESSSNKEELKNKLNEIVPLASTVNFNELSIFELDDNGCIIKLGNYKGLPSDENYLNIGLEESNDLFSKLLDLEDLCQ